VLPQPPHSPDLAASDFQLFGAQQDAIFGKRFGIDDEVTEKAKKLSLVQHYNLVQEGGRCCWFSLAKGLVELDGDVYKNGFSNTYDCFARLRYEIASSKKLCYKTSWTTFVLITLLYSVDMCVYF